MDEIFTQMGFSINKNTYEKNIGFCRVKAKVDDFDEISTLATIDKNKIRHYSTLSDFKHLYKNVEDFKSNFENDFEEWKHKISQLYG